MKKIDLYVPRLEDMWFRRKCMSDKKTMEYNAGYDVAFDGYNNQTGCIDFPEEKWESWYQEKMTNPNFFYAYIKDVNTNEFIGYVNFNKNKETKKASMGIVIHSDYHRKGYMRDSMKELIKEAKKRNVEILTDSVPENRIGAHKVFKENGFIIVKEFMTKKFNKDEKVLEIEKKLI